MIDVKRTLDIFGPLLLVSLPGSPAVHPTMLKAWGLLMEISKNHTTAHACASASCPEGETAEQRLERITDCDAKFLAYARLAVKVRHRVALNSSLTWCLRCRQCPERS